MEGINKNPEIKTLNNSMIGEIFIKAKDNICTYLGIEEQQFQEVLKNFIVRSELSGHNNQIYVIDCCDNQGKVLGTVCVKFSFKSKMAEGLIVEADILKILDDNKVAVPRVLNLGLQPEFKLTFIVLEKVEGKSLDNFTLEMDEINKIYGVIQFHEVILSNNLEEFNNLPVVEELHKEIDFETKILKFLQDCVPHFTVLNSLGFLNEYLNHKNVVDERKLVTDRSVENIFKKENDEIVMIDFSTVRIGTKFDNWIQFIDDPRAHFSCDKEKLVQLFFQKNNLPTTELKFFYVASIYTNLLQGIFTYAKDPQLSISYFENANNAFSKLMNKKSVLIDLSLQHAPRQ